MNRTAIYFGTAALATVLSAPSAFADVSGQDVWGAWKGFMTRVGYEVSSKESQAGQTLTVSDLVLLYDLPDEEGTATISLGDMTFVEQGDGTVRVGMPVSFPTNVTSTEFGETTDVTLTTTLAGMDLVASGAPDDITYTYSANSMIVDLTNLTINGEPQVDMTFTATANAVKGVSSLTEGAVAMFAQSASVDNLALVAKGNNPDDGVFDLNADIMGLALDFKGAVPLDIDPEDPSAFFRAGFSIDGQMSQNGSTITIAGEDDGGPFNGNIRTGASSLGIMVGGGVFDYTGSVSQLALNMQGGGIPLPIMVNMDEWSYGLMLPLLKDTMPQNFSANFNLAGLTVSDMLWGIFDPGAMLPRDPATVSVALKGTTTLFEDLVKDGGDDYPGELNSLSLSELIIDMVGVSASGSGDFTFDNTDLQTFDGMPRPQGSLSVGVKGANKLMDTLVAMGLLPEEQVMGARMMMAMFSVPGPGEDEMNSVIEVNAEGHVLANGQRIQ